MDYWFLGTDLTLVTKEFKHFFRLRLWDSKRIEQLFENYEAK